MKKIAFITMMLSVFMISCHEQPDIRPVYADFEYDPSDTYPAVGEYVYFYNLSKNATGFMWDFGDGSEISTEANPRHFFAINGTYQVTLTAYNDYGQKTYTREINVCVPTLLAVEVAEWNDDPDADIYYVANSRVRLYPTLNDWDEQTNLLYEGYTDDNGVVVFAYIDTSYPYFVDVWDEHHNNEQLRYDNEGYVTIDGLLPDFINWFTAWVDIVSKKEVNGRTEVDYVIRNIERKPIEVGVTQPADKDIMKYYEQSVKIKK